MNGIGLLVLIAAAGQISATPQIAPNRDFGWEIDQQNPDRALCYIVQVSREVAATMERDSYEKTSNLPPELVGRATRIVFRIGNETLPQNPSLEELRNMPLVNSTANVTAQLGGGRMADVEPNAVVTVQQDRTGAPRLPAFPDPSSTSAPQPRTDFADRLQPSVENLVDQAKNLARGTPGVPNASGRDTGNSPPMPDYSTTGSSSRLGGSPLDNNSNSWQGSPSTLGGNSGGDRSRDADNRFGIQNGNQNTVGAAGNFGNGGINPTIGNGQNGNNPDYGSPTPPSLGPPELFTGIPSSQTPSGGFGNYPGNQGQGKFNSGTSGLNNNSGQNQTASGQFPQGGQVLGDGRYSPTSPPAQGPNSPYTGNGQGGFDNFDRIASNTPVGGGRNTNPPLGSDLGGQGAGRPGGAGGPVRENSPSDANNDPQAGSAKSKTLENILPAFFILSLLVNFYLGSLIRKLLTRYRALLANMRGQTSPNVLSA